MSKRFPASAAKRDKNQEYDIESRAPSSDGPAKKKKKLDAKMVIWIDWIFLISSVMGVSLDPFLFQSPVIKEDKKCLFFDKRLYITAIIVRSVTDLIYFANMMLAILETYRKHIQEKKNRPKAEKTASVLKDTWRKARMLWRRWKFLIIDILAIPPLPQVLIPFIFSEKCVSKFLDERGLLNTAVMFRYVALLNGAVLFQYVPRILRIYLTWIKLITTDGISVMAVGIKAAFNFFLYIISSHVFGSFWYLFAVQQELACWHVACNNHVGCIQGSFRCSRSLGSHTFFNDYCPTTTPNSTIHDFGIYTGAFQSGLVTSTNIPGKTVQCFWWGLRSLSSFGQNLETSKDLWECSFASFISLLGLLLFLFFIGNMQIYMELATKKLEKTRTTTQNLKYKHLEIKHCVLSRYGIEDKDMEDRIMGSITDIIKQEKCFDDQRPLLHLPQKLRRDIILSTMRSSLFEKVPSTSTLGTASKDKYLWRSICGSLKPMYLNENTYIIRQGEVLDVMLFINRGTVGTFSTNEENGTGYLKKGDFYGEELLNWVLAPLASFGPSEQIPFSKMTLKCKTKVEVFSLWVDDLRNIVSGTHLRIEKFRLIIGCTDTKDELKDVAAKCLQAAYRRHRAQPKNSNDPRKCVRCLCVLGPVRVTCN